MSDMVDVFQVEIGGNRYQVSKRGRIKKSLLDDFGDGKEIRLGISLPGASEHFLMSMDALHLMHFKRVMTAFHEFRRIPTSGNNDRIIDVLVSAATRPAADEELIVKEPQDLKKVAIDFASNAWNYNWIASRLCKAFNIQQSGNKEI